MTRQCAFAVKYTRYNLVARGKLLDMRDSYVFEYILNLPIQEISE